MDYEDLRTGVDHLIKLGVTDPNDLYVMSSKIVQRQLELPIDDK